MRRQKMVSYGSRRRIVQFSAFGAMVALVVAACGSSHSSSSGTTAAQSSATTAASGTTGTTVAAPSGTPVVVTLIDSLSGNGPDYFIDGEEGAKAAAAAVNASGGIAGHPLDLKVCDE